MRHCCRAFDVRLVDNDACGASAAMLNCESLIKREEGRCGAFVEASLMDSVRLSMSIALCMWVSNKWIGIYFPTSFKVNVDVYKILSGDHAITV